MKPVGKRFWSLAQLPTAFRVPGGGRFVDLALVRSVCSPCLLRDLSGKHGGAAILFYSTDYDELIGLCDRVAIMYDGRIVRELEGTELNETNIVASSLNI